MQQFFQARNKEDRMLTKLEMVQAMQEFIMEKAKRKGFRNETDLRSVP